MERVMTRASEQTRHQVRNQFWDKGKSQFDIRLLTQLHHQIWGYDWTQVWDHVGREILEQIKKDLKDETTQT